MTTTENNIQNLHHDTQQRLRDLTVLTYIYDTTRDVVE